MVRRVCAPSVLETSAEPPPRSTRKTVTGARVTSPSESNALPPLGWKPIRGQTGAGDVDTARRGSRALEERGDRQEEPERPLAAPLNRFAKRRFGQGAYI